MKFKEPIILFLGVLIIYFSGAMSYVIDTQTELGILGEVVGYGIFVIGLFLVMYWNTIVVRKFKEMNKKLMEHNKTLIQLTSMNTQRFLSNGEDFQKRLNYLNKCMDTYRVTPQ